MSKESRQLVNEMWQGEKGAKLVWPGSKEWPDPDAPDILRKLCNGKVCEIGCGTGRVASVFNADSYIGFDINKTAIEIAKQALPTHEFWHVKWDDFYPEEIDTFLFYTVLLHVPDDEIASIAERVNSNQIVIMECMDRSIRKNQWQRDPKEYSEIFEMPIKTHLHLKSNWRPFFRDFLLLERENNE